MCKEWEICKLGNWEVILYDRLSPQIELDKCLLNKIFRLRPNVRKLLFVLDENGFKNTKGASFCRKLEEYIRIHQNRQCFYKALYPKWPQWYYAVVLPRKSVEFIQKEPTYFTFLLGHELEHVELYSSDYDTFALHASWLHDALYDPCRRPNWIRKLPQEYKFPIETHCHRQGKRLAITLYSKKEFREAIERISASGSEAKNKSCFNWVKTLSLESTSANLRKEFIDFCQPYKGALRNLFDKDLKKWEKEGRRTQCKPLAAEINKFDDIFDANYTG